MEAQLRMRGYASGAGKSDVPIRKRSTPRAALRPSAIAHTMSDWPRCMSPAANTPGTLVIQFASRHTLPRSVSLTPKFVEQPLPLGAEKSHRQQHEIDVHLELAAGHVLERHPAVLAHELDLRTVQLS